MVEEVKELRTKLEAIAFSNPKVFQQGKIEVDLIRAAQIA